MFPTPPKSGFALVIALSLMAFILVLLLSVTTMVRVESQSASIATDQLQARQNALLALMVAFGELQKTTGPDQRVTAANGLFAAAGAGTEHITGVWDTTDLNGDGRGDGEFLRWLVSRKDPAQSIDRTLMSEDQPIQAVGDGYTATTQGFEVLVGGGSVRQDPDDPHDPIQGVVAETIELDDKGEFAWWVGDEGVKANLRLRYAADESAPPPIQNLMARRPGLLPFASSLGEPGHFAALEQANLLADIEPALAPFGVAVNRRDHFHDFTVDSTGVLSDTKNGGLKKNLTAAFSDPDDFEKLLQDAGKGPNRDLVFGQHDDSLPAADDPGGPKWAQLRSYFQQGALVTGNQIPLVLPSPGDDVSAVTPVLSQAQLFVYAAYLKDTGTPDELEVVYFLMPAIVLWNPYDKTIQTPELFVRFYRFAFHESNKREPFEWGFAVENSDIGNFNFTAGNRDQIRNPSNFARAPAGQFLRFSLAPNDLPPGAAIIFTPDANRPYDNANPQNMRLARGNNPDFGFYLRTGKRFLDDGTLEHKIKLAGPQTSNTYWEIATAANFQNDSLLQRHTHINSFGIAGSNPETSSNLTPLPEYAPPVFAAVEPGVPIPNWSPIDGSSLNAYPRYGYKASLRLSQNGVDDFGGDKRIQWLGQHNPRAPFTSKTPLTLGRFVGETSSSRGLREPPNFAGSFTQNDFWSQVDESFASTGDSANIGYADTGEGNSRVILFEIPDPDMPFVSLVQLGMTNFSRTNNWDNFPKLDQGFRFIHGNYQPAFPLGNSIPDARIPSAQTSLRWRDHPNIISDDNEVFGAHYDVSYQLNEALFDHFFLSSEGADNLPDPGEAIALPLPNSRLLPVAPGAATHADLRDYDTTAGQFLIDGAFNVNAASVEAWVSLIGAFFGNDVLKRDASGSESTETGDGFSSLPRFFRPTGEAVDAGSSLPRFDGNYLGYRRLDEVEIESLAVNIVEELEKRTTELPYQSLADFINRSPMAADPAFRRRGVLQAAIDNAGLNAHLEIDGHRVKTNNDYTSAYPENLMEGSVNVGVPGFFMQSDLLAKLSPFLSARSDTFRIRAYGSAQNTFGKKSGEALCEAVDRRLPETVDSNFGRRYAIASFRWLSPDER